MTARRFERVVRWDALQPTEVLMSDPQTGVLWVGTLLERTESWSRWLEVAVTDDDWRQALHGEVDLRTIISRGTNAQVVLRDTELAAVANENAPRKTPASWLPEKGREAR